MSRPGALWRPEARDDRRADFKIAVLDDYQGVAQTMANWSGVQSRARVAFFRRNLASVEAAAEALAGFDAL